MDFTTIAAALFGLMLVTNVITQVLKQVTYNKIPTNLLAVLIAFVVTFACGYIYASTHQVAIEGWMIVSAVGVSFFVAFTAMFGFDKLVELIQQWKKIQGGGETGNE